MRYYFKRSEDSARWDAIIEHLHEPFDAPEITLYPETPEILEDYENNDNTDWWPVSRFDGMTGTAGDFATIEEAKEDYYSTEGWELYCYLHDC